MATTNISHEHQSLLAVFHNSFHHHKGKPTRHGLRLFIANIEMAMAILQHAAEDLKELHKHASELLRQVEAEDATVAEYTSHL